MKRSRFTEDQIIGILKEHEAGISVADLCRKHGVSDATVYKWNGLVTVWCRSFDSVMCSKGDEVWAQSGRMNFARMRCGSR